MKDREGIMEINGHEYDISPGADLHGADLRGANLEGARLQEANLRGAMLAEVNLEGADLRKADLEGAILEGANLARASLWGAKLEGAILARADLTEADLTEANLDNADLSGANLTDAALDRTDLRDAYLNGADMTGVRVRKTDLEYTDLRNVQNFVQPASMKILPDDGDVIGWKKCSGNVLVKLRIPAGAKRSNAAGRKCRAEKAEVLEIIDPFRVPGTGTTTRAHSMYNARFTYEVGETVRPEFPFDENWFEECASGIHFFITRQEAEEY